MENITYNFDIILNNEQDKLINSLASYTEMTTQELINNIVNGYRTWEDYKEINAMHEIRLNPSLGEWYNTDGSKSNIFSN